jgi:hypothetical protein
MIRPRKRLDYGERFCRGTRSRLTQSEMMVEICYELGGSDTECEMCFEGRNLLTVRYIAAGI